MILLEVLPLTNLSGIFAEFAVLDHHCVNDTEEAFVGRKKTCPTGHGIALEKAYLMWLTLFPQVDVSVAALTLTSMFRQNLDHTSTFACGVLVPLEVSSCVTKNSVEFVAFKFVWRKYAHTARILDKDLIEEIPGSCETAVEPFRCDRKQCPVRNLQWFIRVIAVRVLAKLPPVILRYDTVNDSSNATAYVDKF